MTRYAPGYTPPVHQFGAYGSWPGKGQPAWGAPMGSAKGGGPQIDPMRPAAAMPPGYSKPGMNGPVVDPMRPVHMGYGSSKGGGPQVDPVRPAAAGAYGQFGPRAQRQMDPRFAQWQAMMRRQRGQMQAPVAPPFPRP